MAEASPNDVRLEIETHLEDEVIMELIEKKTRDIDRDTNVSELDTPTQRDLEAVLTAIHIATRLDRSAERVQTGQTSQTYESSMVDELRADARRLGATDELLGIGATDKRASISVPKTRD